MELTIEKVNEIVGYDIVREAMCEGNSIEIDHDNWVIGITVYTSIEPADPDVGIPSAYEVPERVELTKLAYFPLKGEEIDLTLKVELV